MIHIMHLIESLEFGGAEKVVVHYANKLCVDYKVSICLTKRKGELIEHLTSKVNVYCLNSPEGNNFHLPFKIRDLIQHHQVDVLHTHDWGVYLEGAIAVNKTPCKMIHTVHGSYMEYPGGLISSIKMYIRHYAERYYSKNVCKIVSVSNSIKKYIASDIKIDDSLLATIHNGIDGVEYCNKYNHQKEIRFVTTGRLAKIKNYFYLLDAFNETFKKSSDFHLTIVGDGPEKSRLETYSNTLDIKDNVTFLGFRDDIHEILSENDVYVISSNYEGVSIALLESMRIGMPSIATEVGGIPETVIDDKTGYLVTLNNVKNYSEKILRFINAPDLIKKLGVEAYKLFNNEFHEKVVLEKYRALYLQCLEDYNE